MVNTPDLRLLSVKGDTKSETQNHLVRKTSGLQGIPVGSIPTLGIKYAHVDSLVFSSTGIFISNVKRIEFLRMLISLRIEIEYVVMARWFESTHVRYKKK